MTTPRSPRARSSGSDPRHALIRGIDAAGSLGAARRRGPFGFGGWNRFFNGYLDLISLWFLSTFGIKPMHFFGILGSLMFFVGFVAVIIVGASKLYYMNQGMPYRLVTDSPYFYLSLTSMIIGTQLFVAGFLGELISRNAPERNKYQIEKMI